MNKVILQDKTKSEQLEKQGYCMVDFLDKNILLELNKLLQQYVPQNNERFFSSTHLEDKAKRWEINGKIEHLLKPCLEENILNADFLGYAFLVKPPGNSSVLPLHQDWNLVDETISRSYNFWIPLQDVNEKNGAMSVLAESHQKEQSYRGPGIKNIFDNVKAEALSNMKSLELNFGEAILYDHALLHHSPKNDTDKNRLAVVVGIVPKNSELLHYKGEGLKITIYHSTPSFFFDFDMNSGYKDLTVKSTIDVNDMEHTDKTFKKLYLKNRSGVVAKLINWFK